MSDAVKYVGSDDKVGWVRRKFLWFPHTKETPAKPVADHSTPPPPPPMSEPRVVCGRPELPPRATTCALTPEAAGAVVLAVQGAAIGAKDAMAALFEAARVVEGVAGALVVAVAVRVALVVLR